MEGKNRDSMDLDFLDCFITALRASSNNYVAASASNHSSPEELKHLKKYGRLGYEPCILNRGKINREIYIQLGISNAKGLSEHSEHYVDEALQAQIFNLISEMSSSPTTHHHVLVLVSGDGNLNDYHSSFPNCIKAAIKAGWSVELYSWSQSLNQDYTNRHYWKFNEMGSLVQVTRVVSCPPSSSSHIHDRNRTNSPLCQEIVITKQPFSIYYLDVISAHLDRSIADSNEAFISSSLLREVKKKYTIIAKDPSSKFVQEFPHKCTANEILRSIRMVEELRACSSLELMSGFSNPSMIPLVEATVRENVVVGQASRGRDTRPVPSSSSSCRRDNMSSSSSSRRDNLSSSSSSPLMSDNDNVPTNRSRSITNSNINIRHASSSSPTMIAAPFLCEEQAEVAFGYIIIDLTPPPWIKRHVLPIVTAKETWKISKLNSVLDRGEASLEDFDENDEVMQKYKEQQIEPFKILEDFYAAYLNECHYILADRFNKIGKEDFERLSVVFCYSFPPTISNIRSKVAYTRIEAVEVFDVLGMEYDEIGQVQKCLAVLQERIEEFKGLYVERGWEANEVLPATYDLGVHWCHGSLLHGISRCLESPHLPPSWDTPVKYKITMLTSLMYYANVNACSKLEQTIQGFVDNFLRDDCRSLELCMTPIIPNPTALESLRLFKSIRFPDPRVAISVNDNYYSPMVERLAQFRQLFVCLREFKHVKELDNGIAQEISGLAESAKYKMKGFVGQGGKMQHGELEAVIPTAEQSMIMSSSNQSRVTRTIKRMLEEQSRFTIEDLIQGNEQTLCNWIRETAVASCSNARVTVLPSDRREI